jgi:hypothetical protein
MFIYPFSFFLFAQYMYGKMGWIWDGRMVFIVKPPCGEKGPVAGWGMGQKSLFGGDVMPSAGQTFVYPTNLGPKYPPVERENFFGDLRYIKTWKKKIQFFKKIKREQITSCHKIL